MERKSRGSSNLSTLLSDAIIREDREDISEIVRSYSILDVVNILMMLENESVYTFFYYLPVELGSLVVDQMPVSFVRKLNSEIKEADISFDAHLKVKNLLLGKLLIAQDTQELQKKIMILESEKLRLEEGSRNASQKELSEKISDNLSAYVDDAIKSLESNKKAFDIKANNWNLYGALSFSIAILISLASLSFATYYLIYSVYKIDWGLYTVLSVKILVLIILLCAFSKYAYGVSKAYVHESLIRIDREHAIRFGEMFLKIYGDRLEQAEVKSVFENWNFSSNSAFNVPESKNESNIEFNKAVDSIFKIFELTKNSK
ncbi:hypothetical protein [Shewanella mangrovisoli]|uniref:hypothetical protein n=1 Tax=Shewanella mangrovisoli TaxID=2864211 RepID=UPI0035B77890